MKKTFACAFVLFMFASTTTALAGNKRFCGFIATSERITGNITIGAGAYINKNLVDEHCKGIRNKVKKGLKQTLNKQGVSLWDEYDWSAKDGNKCGHVSDFFTNGRNICGKTGYMKKDKTAYLIKKIGNQPATFEEL